MKAREVVEFYDLMSANKIQMWIDGGWGVDALLKKQTREHKDLDIVIREKDVSKLRLLLKSKGYIEVKLKEARPHNFVLGDKDGHEIDVHVVVFDEQGNGVYGPKRNSVMYPAYSFEGKGKIGDRSVRCLTAEYQVESHTGYNIGKKDVDDVTALCKKFNIGFPPDYLSFKK